MAANPLAAGRSLPRDSCSSIVRCVSPMKRIFSSRVFPLAVGLGLRLLFVLLFPATSGDTVLYEQIATNWLKHHAYAMDVHGALTPVDIRMPGYPAFLALIYALTGRTGESARWWVMLAQIPVDLLGCLVIARLAGMLTCPSGNDAPQKIHRNLREHDPPSRGFPGSAGERVDQGQKGGISRHSYVHRSECAMHIHGIGVVFQPVCGDLLVKNGVAGSGRK